MSRTDAQGQAADFSAVPDAPRSDDPAAVAALALDLAAADYGHDAVTELIGERAMAALSREQPVPAERALAARAGRAASTALRTLVGAFLLGHAYGREDWDAALPRTGAAAAQQIGLLEPAPGEPGALRAAIDLRPHASDADAEVWVASDVGADHRPGVLRHDHVLGIGRASLTLASATIRRPAARALDLGVGCGIQTLHLLSHCEHVTATDLSVRALAFTRFNLALNADALGVDRDRLEDRVRLLRGSLLEPVEGQRFDLVVSNPPFVITPRRASEREAERFTYRDGGMAGDDLVAGLVADLPGVLAPGGTAQLLANWEIPEAAVPDDAVAADPATGATVPGWAGRPAAWLPADAECWVIQRDVEEPTGYAETWLRDAAEARDAAAYAARYGDYLDDFASRGVGGVGLGLIWLRNPEGTPGGVGRRFEALEQAVQQPLGAALGRAVERADELVGTDPGAVHAVPGPDVTVETHTVPGEEHPRVIVLRQGSGLRRARALDTGLAGLVSACDGELDVRSIATAVTALMGAGVVGPEAGEDNVESLVQAAAELLRDGFLDFGPVGP